MKSKRVKRKNFIVRRFRRWLYRLFREEQEVDADLWQRQVVPCFWCQRPIPTESDFCRHCGFSLKQVTDEKTTTGHQKLVNVLPVVGERPRDQGRGVMITSEILAWQSPGERLKDTYKRVREGKTQ